MQHAYDAARLDEGQRRQSIIADASLISEIVFSHPSKVELVAGALAAGFLVHLHQILVPEELSVGRVVERVRRGGHAVPEQKIRGRYQRLWAHVAKASAMADVAEVFDNSNARAPLRLCARFEQGSVIGVPVWPRWTPPELVSAANLHP